MKFLPLLALTAAPLLLAANSQVANPVETFVKTVAKGGEVAEATLVAPLHSTTARDLRRLNGCAQSSGQIREDGRLALQWTCNRIRGEQKVTTILAMSGERISAIEVGPSYKFEDCSRELSIDGKIACPSTSIARRLEIRPELTRKKPGG